MELYLCYGIPCCLYVGFIVFLLKRRRDRQADRLMAGALGLLLISQVFSLLYNHLISTAVLSELSFEEIQKQLFLYSHLSYGMLNGFLYVLTLRFIVGAGKEYLTVRRVILYAIPLAVQIGLLVFNAINPEKGFLLYIPQTSQLIPEEGKLNWLLYAAPVVYYLLSIGWIWRFNRTCLIIYLIMIYKFLSNCFTPFYTTHTTFVEFFFFSLELTYIVLWAERRGVMYQQGGVLLLFFTLLTFLTGNLISNSSFSTYLDSTGDKNIWMLQDMADSLQQYDAFPELVHYWIDHRDEMAEDFSQTVSEDFVSQSERLGKAIEGKGYAEVTGEDFLSLEPDMQKLFAYSAYSVFSTILSLQYEIPDVLLYVTEGPEQGMVLVDTDQFELWSLCGLGEEVDLDKLEERWSNYDRTTSIQGFSWMLTNVSMLAEREYGVHYDFPVEDGLELRMCCGFEKSEILGSLGFIGGFSSRSYLLTGLAALFIQVCLYFILLKPLTAFRGVMEGYRREKNADQVAKDAARIHSRNEIEDLSRDFSSLTMEIARYTEEVSRLNGEKERIGTELRVATNIQKSALPVDFPECPEFSLYALMEPAKEVGGDFYDFFRIGEDQLGLVMADVSDKGVPAALFMMASKQRIKTRALMGGDPGTILTEVNAQICQEAKTNMFVTVWLGILNLRTGELAYANAGHEYPIIRGEDGVFRLLKEKHGIVLGGISKARYQTNTLQLKPGNAVFVYTDGAPEARNADDAFYQLDRLEAALNRSPMLEPRELLQAVRADISDFVAGAPQFDDLTMMCVTWKKSSLS